ncbi:hypothetical protein HZP33_13610 [Elizabethkingia anophelis]|nr:hypothetical protein [Elizabethkingia anophelis]
MTVIDILMQAHLQHIVQKPFMEMADFVKVSGLDRNKIHKMLINDLSGVRYLVFGGYDKYQKYNKGKKLCFETVKVLDWLKNRE